jgi:hypothetical protein
MLSIRRKLGPQMACFYPFWLVTIPLLFSELAEVSSHPRGSDLKNSALS